MSNKLDEILSDALESGDLDSTESVEVESPETLEVVEKVQTQEASTATDDEIEAPISWAKEEKDIFKSLPKELQSTIARRESEREKRFTQITQQASKFSKEYSEIDELFAPYAENLSRQGVSKAQIIKQLVSMQSELDNNPEATLSQLAQRYKVDLARATTQAEANPLLDKINQLETYLYQKEQVEAQRQVEFARQQNLQDIQVFMDEKDATGKPKRPHFEKIIADVVPLVQQLRSNDPYSSNQELLSKAYEQVTWSHPEIRQELINAQIAADQAKHRQEQNRKVTTAKSHYVSLSGSPEGSSTIKATKQSLDDILKDAMSA